MWDKPDNLGTVLFVNGINGEGARTGRKGWGLEVGEVFGKSTSFVLSLITEILSKLNEVQQDSCKPVQC